MRIAGYDIRRELGRGGMASVYLAMQETLGRQIALKVMASPLVADKNFTERFMKEGRIVAHLEHPKVVTVYDIGFQENNYYLAMEYLPGGTLQDKIEQGVSIKQALSIIKTIADALGYAHNKGIVHRDVKPLNVMFRKDGTPVLTDFGIAKIVGSNTQLTAPGSPIGSPLYMSPEQITGKTVDGRSDLYCLGVMFYQMLTGKLPYEGDDPFSIALMHTQSPLPTLPKKFAIFQPVLERMLAKEPDDRFNTAEDFIQALKRIERQYLPRNGFGKTVLVPETAAAQTPEQPPTLSAWTRWPKVGLVAGAALVLIIAVVYLAPQLPIWTPQPDPEPIEISEGPQDTEQQRIQRLLVKAREQRELLKMSTPPGDNAYESYRQVLELEPENQEAKKELARLGTYYQQQAEQHRRQGALQESLEQIDKGLVVAPEHTGLQNLRKELQAQLNAANRKAQLASQVSQLLAKAEQQLRNSQLLIPAGDNAYESYLQVLGLDPENRKAQEGVARIATHYQQLAEQYRQQGKLQKSLVQIEKGLGIMPKHPGLLTLRKEIEAQQTEGERKQAAEAARQGEIARKQAAELERRRRIEQQQREIEQRRAAELEQQRETDQKQAAEAVRQREIDGLLELAERQQHKLRLVEPAGDNAYETYQRVLALDGDNLGAKLGMMSICDHYQKQAQLHLREGALKKSLTNIDKGLKVMPDNVNLLALREEVEAQQVRRGKTPEKQQEGPRIQGISGYSIKPGQF